MEFLYKVCLLLFFLLFFFLCNQLCFFLFFSFPDKVRVAQIRFESFYPLRVDEYANFIGDAAKEMGVVVSGKV